MTIYSSGKKISHDRYPYRSRFDGTRWTDPGVDEHGLTVLYDPRPEFDHKPSNPENPILAAFREYMGDDDWSDLSLCAGIWRNAIDNALDPSWGAYHALRDVEGNATGEHSNHARRVLSRLAALA